MATVPEMIERFERLRGELPVLVDMSVEDTAKEFGELNRDQWRNSKTKENTPILPAYSKAYAKRKGFSNPDLKNTGDFYAGYRLQVINNELIEDSDVDYAQYIERRYGPSIWGLTDENRGEYINEFFRPDLMQKVREILKLP